MKTSDNITVTDGRLRKALQNKVENIVIPQINSKVNKTAKDAKIQIATMTKFYPYLDKCEVDLNGNLTICKILHRFGGGLIDFYTPQGSKDYCENLHEPCIIPLDGLQCLILDINDGSNEQVMIGYFLPNEIIGFDPADSGNLKLTCVGATNHFWIKFGAGGLDVRSRTAPVTNVGEFESSMENVEYATKKDLNDLIIGEVDLTEVYNRLDELQSEINNIGTGGNDLTDYVKKDDLIDKTKYDIDLSLNVGRSGMDDLITIDLDIVDHTVNKTINI